jgi:hypothetical protein
MIRIFAPPPGYSPAKLAVYAVLSFVLTALALVPALDRENGIPDRSALREAHGRVTSVSPHRYGIRFQLYGRAEIFEYPSKARGGGVAEAALRAAGNRDLAVLFDRAPQRPWFSSDAYYNVWELAIDGKTVRSFAESKDGWRSDNAVTPWLCAGFLLFGVYLSLLAWRAHHARTWL